MKYPKLQYNLMACMSGWERFPNRNGRAVRIAKLQHGLKIRVSAVRSRPCPMAFSLEIKCVQHFFKFSYMGY